MGELHEMRALTLKPHWAHAVAHLGKRCEARSWPIPEALAGQRIAIHAGATLPKGWESDLLNAHPAGPTSIVSVLGSIPVRSRAIVATAVLRTCWPSDEDGDGWPIPAWLNWRDYSAAYWWRLDDVRTLAKPVPLQRGQLGLWRLPLDVVSQVLEVDHG